MDDDGGVTLADGGGIFVCFFFLGFFLYKLSWAFFLLFCGLCGHKPKPIIKIQMTKTSLRDLFMRVVIFRHAGGGGE